MTLFLSQEPGQEEGQGHSENCHFLHPSTTVAKCCVVTVADLKIFIVIWWVNFCKKLFLTYPYYEKLIVNLVMHIKKHHVCVLEFNNIIHKFISLKYILIKNISRIVV